MSTGDLSSVGRTAFAVALARAAEAARDHPWFVDPLAVRLAASVPTVTRERVSSGLTAWVAVRTRFLDELTLLAMDRGIRQIVLLGAGLDARAYRLGLPEGATVFEVDRLDVFAAKRRVMTAAGLDQTRRQEVVADVLLPGWLDGLTAAGWHHREPTLWILEGFLIYFEAETRTRLLTELAAVSADGSELGATMTTRSDEPHDPRWHLFDTEDIPGWFAECGWGVTVTTMLEVSNRFGRPLPSELALRLTGLLVAGERIRPGAGDGASGEASNVEA
jgi:methyltransferase (TIGR00027 family)